MDKVKHALLIATGLYSGIASASSTVTGTLTHNGLPISGATVSIADATTQTQADGQFLLNVAQPGSLTLHWSHPQYVSSTQSVTAIEGQMVNVGALSLTEMPERIQVLGNITRGEASSLLLQKQAKSIKNWVSADGIGKLPDRNAAEAVARIPGISIERDQGEGRFVAIRGLPSQWNSATINGDRLPTAEEETTSRATAFDFFPSELIEYVEVSKALTPDMEGDAIGGSVNFITKNAPTERMLSVSAGYGDAEQAQDNAYNVNLLFGDRIGDRFGYLINGTVWERGWGTDNYEPRRGGDSKGIKRLELRDYTGERTTYGVNVSAEYELDGSSVYARYLYGTLEDDERHFKHRYRFDKDRVELQHIHNELITEMHSAEIGGDWEFGDGLLDWKLATYVNEFRYGDVPNGQDNSYFVARFDQTDVGYQGLGCSDASFGCADNLAYNTIDGGSDPWDAISTHLPSDFAMVHSQTKLKYIELYKIHVEEKDKLVAQLNYRQPLSDELELKLGLKYRDKERRARYADEFYTWDESKGPTPTLADFALIDQPGRSDFLDQLDIDYSTQFSQVVPLDVIADFWTQNRDNFVLDTDESISINLGRGLGRNFDLNETHQSVYGMLTYEGWDNWIVLGGVRATRTDTEVHGYAYQADTQTLSRATGNKDYWSILPSLHLTYQFSDDTNFRLALTRSFARPDFGQISPGTTYSEADNELVGGNPDLDPTYANNIDLLFEHFFDEVGVFAAGVFYKDIQDPIFTSTRKGEYLGQTGVTIMRPDNGDDAWLAGMELTYNSSFEFLSPALSHFGFMTNATITDSQMTIPERDKKVNIPRQADLLYNASLYFDNKTASVRLAYNFKDEYIEEHGSSDATDRYYGEYASLDFSATYQINDAILLYLEANNLTDEPLHYYLGDEDRPLQVEYYGAKAMVGFKGNF